jgi:hypothetical protein
VKASVGAILGALLFAATAGAQPPPTPTPAPTPVPNEQPNAPGLGLPPPTPHPVDTKALELNDKEKEALKDVEAEFERFQKAAETHDKRVRAIAKREYDSRTNDLEKRYADRIAKTETDRTKRHADTIALIEKFLKAHPNHQQFTPDKMFQLADLYLDQANDEVDAMLAAQEKNPDANTEQPAPTADYSKSLALWEDILKNFPDYRQTPSTLYLLAYYTKSKDERKSLQVFLALACANKYKWNGAPPKVPTHAEAVKRIESKTLRDPYADCTPYPNTEVELARHAWVRGVADAHFTVAGELDEAIAAYRKVADGGSDSKLYAESMYKLAWSFYKRDFLRESIHYFDESVKLYDSIVAKGDQPPLELRDESIQYIAVALTDPWAGETDTDPAKAFQRAKEVYKGRENEPHVRDVWVALGHAFGDLQAWDQSVDSYRIAIGPPWELDPKNPVVHQEIVNAYEAKGDKFAADQAAAELATKYGPGTKWYAANDKNREAMENQRRIAERALYAAAKNTHAAASLARKDYEGSPKKDPSEKAAYISMYVKAVDLYRTFINTYPESDYIYEFHYLDGDALFYGERYGEAIAEYKFVRDHKELGTAYYLDAARSVLLALEAETQKLAGEGKLAPLKVPTVADLKALPQPWTPQQIPQIYLDLQAEYDNYQNVIPDPQAAPGQGINAALISLAYLHVDDAVARFRKVIEKFCNVGPAEKNGTPPSAKAKDGILAILEAQGNYDAMQAENTRFISNQCGDPKTRELAKAQTQALDLERANDMFKKGQYIAAAEKFYTFYKRADPGNPDLPVALYDTAVAYKLGDRPKTAIALFKEFTSNTSKTFRESPYYLDALRLTAASYQQAFDYDNAVKTYLELYDTTKKAKKLKIKPPDPLPGEKALTLDQIGLDALYNAGFAAELNRDFRRAVDLYTQYGRVETDRHKLDRALWSIANIYRQSGDVNAMTETLDRWRAKYGNDPGNEDDIVKSYADTAVLLRKKGRTGPAKEAEQKAIAAWQKHGAVKNSKGAKLAAEYALADAEEFYAKTWVPLQIKTVVQATKKEAIISQLGALTDQIKKVQKTIEDKYIALDQYGVLEASMAAKVRYGDIQYDAGQKIHDIPIPAIIAKNPDAVGAYEEQRDKNLEKYLNEAKADWSDVADKAKQGGVSNKWSQHAVENLAREFPDQYHVLRQELVQGTDAP